MRRSKIRIFGYELKDGNSKLQPEEVPSSYGKSIWCFWYSSYFIPQITFIQISFHKNSPLTPL